MQPRPESCAGCPALERGHGYVAGSGPNTATIALIGQGPGSQEVQGLSSDAGRIYRPFVGPSGAKLQRWIDVVNDRRLQAGKAPVQRADLFIDNIVRCHLTQGRKDRPPTAREVAHCTKAHLLPTLATLPNLRVVVALGGPAATWLFGKPAGEQWAGHRQWVDLNERRAT